jgi:hypothetical protein
MNQWKTDYAAAVTALETAYDTDRRVYASLDDETKSTWALQSMQQWPQTALDGPMAPARAALIEAERKVCAVVQRQSVALRNARCRRAAMIDPGRFAATIPMTLEPARPLPIATRDMTKSAWPTRLG